MNNFPFRSFAFPVLLLVLWPIGGAKVWSQDREVAAYPCKGRWIRKSKDGPFRKRGSLMR
jgi:hypothetical protein